jgi:hypothetical protein
MGKSKGLEKDMEVLQKLLQKLGKKLATGPKGVELSKIPPSITDRFPGVIPKKNFIAWWMNGKRFHIGIPVSPRSCAEVDKVFSDVHRHLKEIGVGVPPIQRADFHGWEPGVKELVEKIFERYKDQLDYDGSINV